MPFITPLTLVASRVLHAKRDSTVSDGGQGRSPPCEDQVRGPTFGATPGANEVRGER